MKKRQKCPVCRCMPEQGVKHLEVKVLRQLLNREIHPIRCAWSLRRKAQKARILGDLCAGANHPEMAIKIWVTVEEMIINEDDRWLDEERVFDIRLYTLDSLMAEEEALDLGRQADELYRKLGHPEWAGYEDYARAHYYWTKYYRKQDCYDWLKENRAYLSSALERKNAEDTFNEGLPDWQPESTKDFFAWIEGSKEEEENIAEALQEVDDEMLLT